MRNTWYALYANRHSFLELLHVVTVPSKQHIQDTWGRFFFRSNALPVIQPKVPRYDCNKGNHTQAKPFLDQSTFERRCSC